jgi:hypothetical protein
MNPLFRFTSMYSLSVLKSASGCTEINHVLQKYYEYKMKGFKAKVK